MEDKKYSGIVVSDKNQIFNIFTTFVLQQYNHALAGYKELAFNPVFLPMEKILLGVENLSFVSHKFSDKD
jgi:hypothetical protein